jgi:parallel beta-helix repeat protein
MNAQELINSIEESKINVKVTKLNKNFRYFSFTIIGIICIFLALGTYVIADSYYSNNPANYIQSGNLSINDTDINGLGFNISSEGTTSFSNDVITSGIYYNNYTVQENNGSDIQAKLDLCNNGNCKISLLPGTYVITSTIDLANKTNINIECMNLGVVLDTTNSSNYTFWLGNNSRVANCYFEGNLTETSNSIRMESFDTIENNYFNEGGGIVYANNQEYSTVKNNYWHVSVTKNVHGIFLSNNANHNNIIENKIVGEFQRGMYILDTNNNLIKNNFISGNRSAINTARGIYVQWGNEYTTIEDNYIENIYYSGISLQQADSGIYGYNLNNVIRGNTIVGTSSSGILIDGENNLTINTVVEGNKLYDVNSGINVAGGLNTIGTIIANNYIQGTHYEALDLDGSGSSAFNNQFLEDASVSGNIMIGDEIDAGTAKIFNYDPNTDNIWNSLPFKSFSWGNWTSNNIPDSGNISALWGSSLRLFPNGALDDILCIDDGRVGDVITMRAKYDTGNIRLNNNDSSCSTDSAIHFVNQYWNTSQISSTDVNDFFTCRKNGDDGWYCDVQFHDRAKLNDWSTLSNYPPDCNGAIVSGIGNSLNCSNQLDNLTTSNISILDTTCLDSSCTTWINASGYYWDSGNSYTIHNGTDTITKQN